MLNRVRYVIALLVVAACDKTPAASTVVSPEPAAPSSTPSPVASAVPPPSPSASSAPVTLSVKAVPLPGATGPASLDYIAYEPSRASGHSRVWVPVGVTGSVDVYDIKAGAFTRIDGFKTGERDGHGKKRVVGPSSVTIGDGFAYVGDRATSEVCPIDLKTLTRSACLKLKAGIDGVSYVALAHEVWVTTPDEHTLTILDAKTGGSLKLVGTVKTDGDPEGYAVDEAHGLFFTNLEDKGGTVVIDVKTRAVTATWAPGCGPDGPRGVAVDEARRVVFVACTDHIQALDAAANGAKLGQLDTGAGVDNIDYVPSTQTLYVAAGKASRLTVVHVGDHGQLTAVATASTHEGARNAVADEAGAAYIADSAGASLLIASSGK